MSSILYETEFEVVATGPPPSATINDYSGMSWTDVTTQKKYWYSPTAGWISIDTAMGMAVERSGITLTSSSPNVPSVALENIGGSLSIGGSPVPTMGIGSVAQMLAIPDPQPGQEFYTTDSTEPQLNKKFIYSGRTWQSPGSTIELQCGEALNLGAVVEVSPNLSYSCRKCRATRDKDVVGTMFKQQALGDWATVCISGIWDVAVVFGTYVSGAYLLVDSQDGFASATTSATSGIFAQVLESKSVAVNGGTVKAFVFTVEHY